jgi:hypothetical protein
MKKIATLSSRILTPNRDLSFYLDEDIRIVPDPGTDSVFEQHLPDRQKTGHISVSRFG